jgi:AcrR family transcriptional regulator
MSTPLPTSRATDRYEDILDAALRLFVTRGFHGTAVPDVARKAGVAAGTIYHYFPGKEALVNALYRKWKEAVARAVYTAFPVDGAPRAQFSIIWRTMAAFATANPEAFAFLELHHHGSYLDAESQRVENGLKDFGAAFVRRAQTLGALKPMDPVLQMELVFGAFIGMMRARWEGRLQLDDAALTAAENACWDMVALR